MFIGKLNMERKKNTFNIHELIDEKDVTPELFYTIVEISKGSKNKYEGMGHSLITDLREDLLKDLVKFFE